MISGSERNSIGATAAKEINTVFSPRVQSKPRFSNAHLKMLCCVVAVLGLSAVAVPAQSGAAEPYDLKTFSNHTVDAAKAPYTVAGGHPDQNITEFSVSAEDRIPVESLNGTYVKPPLGFIGNPAAALRCQVGRLRVDDQNHDISDCPPSSRIGFVLAVIGEGGENNIPLYNLVPERGFPAQFGFMIGNAAPTVLSVFPQSRTNSYGLTVGTPNIPSIGVSEFRSTFCVAGIEGDGIFDPYRCASASPLAGSPFLSNPVNCSETEPAWRIAIDSTEHAGALVESGVPDLSDPDWKTDSELAPPVTGCDDPLLVAQFKPTIAVKPQQNGGTTQTDQPSGLAVDLEFPQSNDPTDPEYILGDKEYDPSIPQAPAPKDITVKLPAGLSISPSSADGLDACSDLASDPAGDQVHYDTTKPVTCPDAAKIGSAVATSPLLATHDPQSDEVNGAEPIPGDVYLLKPHPGDLPVGGGNQEGKFRLLIELENPRYGINFKLPGVAIADKDTGQLTTVFTDNPQLPASHLTVNLKTGPRAPLASPVTCGNFTTTSDFVPWSTPGTPNANPTASFNVGSGANGSACASNPAQRPFSPTMSAGTESSKAGAHSPFVLRINRADGDQELSGLEAVLPKGLAATFVGVPYCSEAALAAAATRPGKAELATPTCPASRIGSVTVGAGPGANPFHTGGTAYLAGPYKGAPLSVAVITPAVAGPFDLGTVVVRNALYVNPDTAQGRVVSDPFPKIIDGVPLRLRSIAVRLDRPKFTLNPTNCEPMAVNATLTSTDGATATPSNAFQVGSCKELNFKPTLSLALKGDTQRSGNPALTAILKAPPGQANIAQTSVLLPTSQYIDNAHINNPCTRVQFNANACPASSILGTAVAYTPLLEQPLTGPVYFRANGGERELPDMVVDLNGQIHVTLVGFIDAVQKKGTEESRVRTRFLSIPDAPVTKFVLKLKGGKKGLIENSKNLCTKKIGPATVKMTAQNGRINNFGTKLKTSCKKGKKGKAKASKSLSGLFAGIGF